MKRYQWKKWLIGAAISVMAVGSLAYASSEETQSSETTLEAPQIEWEDEWVIPEGISIGQIDLKGMTVADAKTAVNKLADQLLNREITVDMNGKEYKTTPKDVGVTWANPQVVDEAFSHMTKGNFVKRYKNQVDLKTEPVALNIQLNVNEQSGTNYAQSLVDACTVQVVEPSVTRSNGKFQVVEGKNERHLM